MLPPWSQCPYPQIRPVAMGPLQSPSPTHLALLVSKPDKSVKNRAKQQCSIPSPIPFLTSPSVKHAARGPSTAAWQMFLTIWGGSQAKLLSWGLLLPLQFVRPAPRAEGDIQQPLFIFCVGFLMDLILFYCYDLKSTLQVKIIASVSILLSAFWKDFVNLQVKIKSPSLPPNSRVQAVRLSQRQRPAGIYLPLTCEQENVFTQGRQVV